MKKLLSILLIGFYSSLAHSESDFTLYNKAPGVITSAYAISAECEKTVLIPLPPGGLKSGEFSRFTTGGHWYSPCSITEVGVNTTGYQHPLREIFDNVDNRNFCVINDAEQWRIYVGDSPGLAIVYGDGGC
jgi:hypothetical protein